MTEPSPGLVVAMEQVEKSWVSADRRFTLQVANFQLGAGEIIAVTGESGSGKSTFLELVGLVGQPDRADRFAIWDDSRPVDIMALHRTGNAAQLAALRAKRIGFVLQTGGLLPFLSVAANIALAQELAGLEQDEAQAQRAAILQRLDIAGAALALPSALSIGQRQRAAIARAMAHRPGLVLADEPTAALDPLNKERVVDLLLHLAHDQGAAVIIATHEHALFTKRKIEHAAIVIDSADPAPDHVRARLSRRSGP